MRAVRVTYNCEHCGKKLHMNKDCKCPEALADQEEKSKWPSHVIGGTDEIDNKLVKHCESIILIMRLQSKPQLGDWNWPGMADDLEEVINKFKTSRGIND